MYTLALLTLFATSFTMTYAVPASSAASSPVASNRPVKEFAVMLSVPNWLGANMTKNEHTFPQDKGGWGGLGYNSWSFLFKPEGDTGGYRREDFDLTIYKKEGNWTVISDDWNTQWDSEANKYVSKPLRDRKPLPPVEKKVPCTIEATRPLTDLSRFTVNATSPYIFPAELDGVKASCKLN